MPEKIFLTYTNATAVPYQGTVLGHHIVLNYIDSNGFHHTLQGVPEHRFDHNLDKLIAFSDAELTSDNVNNRDSPFRRLKVLPERVDSDASPNQPHTMVAEGDDLGSRWALMKDFADEVNSIGYEYRSISQNSNSFAAGALQRGGFFGPGTTFPERFDRQLVFDPMSGETRSFMVPGFEKSLANPINTDTPMPFPLNAPAARSVPTNDVRPPDRSGSFADRYGNPTTDRDGSQPPLPVRRLVRVPVDDPRASAFDDSAPTAPSPSYTEMFHQYLKQLTAGQSQAPASRLDINIPTPYQSVQPMFAPPDYSAKTGNGSVEKWIASLAGVDPDDPTRFQVPPIFSPFYRR